MPRWSAATSSAWRTSSRTSEPVPLALPDEADAPIGLQEGRLDLPAVLQALLADLRHQLLFGHELLTHVAPQETFIVDQLQLRLARQSLERRQPELEPFDGVAAGEDDEDDDPGIDDGTRLRQKTLAGMAASGAGLPCRPVRAWRRACGRPSSWRPSSRPSSSRPTSSQSSLQPSSSWPCSHSHARQRQRNAAHGVPPIRSCGVLAVSSAPARPSSSRLPSSGAAPWPPQAASHPRPATLPRRQTSRGSPACAVRLPPA